MFRIFLLLICIVMNLDANIVRRAAFDFGSGKIRLYVADVDTQEHQIISTVYTESFRVF